MRIEDTDKERSKKEYEKDMLECLKWIGLDWDEDFFRQSERTATYKKNSKSFSKKKRPIGASARRTNWKPSARRR